MDEKKKRTKAPDPFITVVTGLFQGEIGEPRTGGQIQILMCVGRAGIDVIDLDPHAFWAADDLATDPGDKIRCPFHAREHDTLGLLDAFRDNLINVDIGADGNVLSLRLKDLVMNAKRFEKGLCKAHRRAS
jgi:hypothetical protein